jgi:hypothetical protein
MMKECKETAPGSEDEKFAEALRAELAAGRPVSMREVRKYRPDEAE